MAMFTEPTITWVSSGFSGYTYEPEKTERILY